jgi:hypothetical protein
MTHNEILKIFEDFRKSLYSKGKYQTSENAYVDMTVSCIVSLTSSTDWRTFLVERFEKKEPNPESEKLKELIIRSQEIG